MKDLFTEYKKQALKKNIAILSASFVFALSLNGFLFGTDAGNRLQTSVANYSTQKTASAEPDLYLVSAGENTDILKLKAGTDINDVKEMSANVLFDSSKISIQDIFSENKNLEIVKTSNVEGVMLLMLRSMSGSINMAKESDIVNIVYKKKETGSGSIILSETLFKNSKKDMYELSNKSIQF